MEWGAFEVLGLAALCGVVGSLVLLLLGKLASRRARSSSGAALVRRLAAPLVLLGGLAATRLAMPLAALEASQGEVLRHALVLALLGLVGWILVGLAAIAGLYLEERFPVGAEDNLEARRVHTRYQVLRRVFVVLTVALCSLAALMTFPGMRALGAGLLASAGIIGIVVGVAARPTVEALIAGIQVAWTQPARLDDVVIIEGEWGRVEEIAATYAVIRLWDRRRLIVPIAHLLSRPFQNWTRKSADLLGAVTLEVDYTTPVAPIREQVGRMLAESEHFAGPFWNLQVVEAGAQTMRLRALFDVPNADVGWELRCEVREKLIAYLQAHHPQCLPRIRAEVTAADANADAADRPARESVG